MSLNCDCRFINLGFRILSVLSLLGMAVSAGYLVLLGSREYLGADVINANGDILISHERLGVFHAVNGILFILFAIVGVLGEVRVMCLRTTVLKHLGFLHTFIGRGCTYMLLGTIFCAIPVAPTELYVTIVPGAVLVACGAAQLILGCCVVKEPRSRRGGGGGNGGGHAHAATTREVPDAPDAENPPGTVSKVKLVSTGPAGNDAGDVATTNPFRGAVVGK